MDRKQIVNRFNEREIEASQDTFGPDCELIIEQVAEDLGVPAAEVQSVMIDEWTCQGAG